MLTGWSRKMTEALLFHANGVVDQLDLLRDGRRAQLEEQARQRGAAGAAVQPQHDGVILRIVARLEKP